MSACIMVLSAQPLAKGMGKFLGCGTSSFLFRDLDLYWNQISPGNDGKWGSVENIKGQYNWTNLDKIYTYAVNRNIQFKQHTFVWGSQQPSWISTLDSASQRSSVESWIKKTAERYPAMAFVDVVNEPINAPPSYKNALGGNGTTGWDWVITSFQMARKYCAPSVKLILNEYNLLHSNTNTTNYLAIINLLKERGLIDGIAVQGHYFEFRSDISSASKYVYDLTTIKYNLNRLTSTGLPVYLSEFDIDEPIDSNQVAQYKIYFPLFWNNPGVKGITFWGYIQDDVWNSHPNTYLLLSDGTERPALKWLRKYILSPLAPVLASPLAAVDVPRNAKLQWHSSDSAFFYRVQIAYGSTFVLMALDTVVSDTVLQTAPLDSNRNYYWRVSAMNSHGASDFSSPVNFMTGNKILSAAGTKNSSLEFSLLQNYPNPFNPSTSIMYTLEVTAQITLGLYDMLGREMKVLFSGERHAGTYSVTLDGSELAGGIYYCRMIGFNKSETKKLTLLK